MELIAKGVQIGAINDDKRDIYQNLVGEPSKFLTLATELKEILGANEFSTFVYERFHENSPEPSEVHEEIIRSKAAKFIVTTNYDDLLEKAHYKILSKPVTKHVFDKPDGVLRSMSKGKFFILKAHGDAADHGNDIILTKQDYRSIINNALGYQSILTSIFSLHSMLFIGASLNDPEILLLLDFLHSAFPVTGGPNHFALMPEEELTDVEKERWRKDYNIRILSMSQEDISGEILGFIQNLNRAIE
jgi:hypothetical protein